MGFGSLTFKQEAATGDMGFFCLVGVSCKVPPGKPSLSLWMGQLPSPTASQEVIIAGTLTTPMARFQVRKTQEGPTLSWGFLRRMGPRRTDSSPWRASSVRCQEGDSGQSTASPRTQSH